MNKLNQKGFGVIESLLILIALTMIGGVGFYVVNANKDKEETKPVSQSNQQAETKPAEQKKSQYLEIKEFGVKIKLDDNLKGIKYVVPQDGEIALSSDELTPLVKACFPNEEQLGANQSVLMSVGKTNGTYAQKQGTDETFLKQFDSFYLSTGLGSIACAGSTETAADQKYNARADELHKSAIEAFKAAEKL